jgi:phosphatidylglycerophosphatase A
MAERALGQPKSDPAAARAALAAMPWLARQSLTVGGLGYARFASGTWGSLPPCVAALLAVAVLPAGWWWGVSAVMLALLAWAAFGCERWGTRAEELVGTKDPSCVVLDEVAGMSIALLGHRWALRDGSEGLGWLWAALVTVGLAFVFFRALDIVKPPPCRALQEVKGGRGILLDDVLAGVYACVATHLVNPFMH